MDPSLVALRAFRSVAECGSFTAAAAATGYTQSAVSRQIAALEGAVGRSLVERRTDGVRLTAAGRTLLHRATRALDEIEAAERELAGEQPGRPRVRLGAFAVAGAWLAPHVAARLRARGVDVVVSTGSTRALVAALRAGSVDVAVVALAPPFRPFDEERPALVTHPLDDHELMVAVPQTHPFADRGAVPVDELADQPWIGTRVTGGDVGLGVWPGLPGRPRVVHSSPDWMVKLQLVVSGAGLTTVPHLLRPVLPPGVRTIRVVGGSSGQRRAVVAHLPHDRPGDDGSAPSAVPLVVDALQAASATIGYE